MNKKEILKKAALDSNYRKKLIDKLSFTEKQAGGSSVEDKMIFIVRLNRNSFSSLSGHWRIKGEVSFPLIHFTSSFEAIFQKEGEEFNRLRFTINGKEGQSNSLEAYLVQNLIRRGKLVPQGS